MQHTFRDQLASVNAEAEVIDCEEPLTKQGPVAVDRFDLEQARPSTWLFWVLHREWCDHIILHQDGVFEQGRLGGRGMWQLIVPSSGALLLELKWSSESGGHMDIFVSPDGSTYRFVAGVWEMRRVGDDELPLQNLARAPQPRRALVFSSVGRQSLPVVRDHWLCSPAAANFDLSLVYYKELDSDAYRGLAELANSHSFLELTCNAGLKWPNFRRWIGTQGGAEAVVARYDYIWVVDDDVRLSTDCINSMFSILRSHENIQFASPSFDEDSVGVWRYFDTHDPQYHIRYTDFAECTATVIKSSMLLDATFARLLTAANTGCFLDLCFHPVSGGQNDAVAIIDAVQANHPPRDQTSPSEMHETLPWEDHKGDMVYFQQTKLPKEWWWYRKPRVIGGVLLEDAHAGCNEEWEIIDP